MQDVNKSNYFYSFNVSRANGPNAKAIHPDSRDARWKDVNHIIHAQASLPSPSSL